MKRPASESDVAFAPEELRCPACGHSLYGSTDTRCAECGKRFEWAEVERRALQWRQSPLFEHHYLDDPARSLLRTWGQAAFTPWRVWAVYDRSDPPWIRPLAVFLVLQLLLFMAGWETLAVPLDHGMNALAADVLPDDGQGFVYSYYPRMGLRGKTLTVLWLATTFVALQLMFQSKRRVGANWRHIFRVFVHGTALASMCTVAWCLAEAMLDVTFLFRDNPTAFGTWPTQRTYERMGLGLLIAFGGWTWVAIAYGLREHLAMKRSLVVVFAAMLIGGLITNAVDAVLWRY